MFKCEFCSYYRCVNFSNTAVGIAYRRETAESRKAEDTMEAGIQLRVRSTEQRQVMKTVVSIERRMSLLLSAFRYDLFGCRVKGKISRSRMEDAPIAWNSQSGKGIYWKANPKRSPVHIVRKHRRWVEAWYPPPED